TPLDATAKPEAVSKLHQLERSGDCLCSQSSTKFDVRTSIPNLCNSPRLGRSNDVGPVHSRYSLAPGSALMASHRRRVSGADKYSIRWLAKNAFSLTPGNRGGSLSRSMASQPAYSS